MPAAMVEEDGSNVTETIKRQSRWNRWAAIATGIATLLQALATACPDA